MERDASHWPSTSVQSDVRKTAPSDYNAEPPLPGKANVVSSCAQDARCTIVQQGNLDGTNGVSYPGLAGGVARSRVSSALDMSAVQRALSDTPQSLARAGKLFAVYGRRTEERDQLTDDVIGHLLENRYGWSVSLYDRILRVQCSRENTLRYSLNCGVAQYAKAQMPAYATFADVISEMLNHCSAKVVVINDIDKVPSVTELKKLVKILCFAYGRTVVVTAEWSPRSVAIFEQGRRLSRCVHMLFTGDLKEELRKQIYEHRYSFGFEGS